MLQAVELTKLYASIPAVQDVTFELRTGQTLGCLGPNGSGKSTTVENAHRAPRTKSRPRLVSR